MENGCNCKEPVINALAGKMLSILPIKSHLHVMALLLTGIAVSVYRLFGLSFLWA
jgi:hypothetical protein